MTNKALSGNVATLTTAGNHGFAAGDVVTVSLGDATFDGTFTVLGSPAPTGTAFSYAKTAADVAATTVSPVGLAGLAVRPVNRLARLSSSGNRSGLTASAAETGAAQAE